MSKNKNKEIYEMEETQASDQYPDQFQQQKQQMFFQIKHLNQQRVQQEAEQEFENAARVKEELMRLGDEFKNLVVYELRRKQEEEREMFEMQYQQEIQNLNQNWGKVLMQNEQEIEEYLMSLDEKQQSEFEQARNKLFENVKTGRYTPEILNLEYQMQQLVKKQRYKEAAHLKKKMIKLIEKQNIKNNRKAQSSITNKLENFQEQQLKEKAAVEQKLIAQRNELLLRREKDFQSIEYKYNVYKEKLDLKHQHQVMDQQKNLKNFNPSSNYFLQDFEEYDNEQFNLMSSIFLILSFIQFIIFYYLIMRNILLNNSIYNFQISNLFLNKFLIYSYFNQDMLYIKFLCQLIQNNLFKTTQLNQQMNNNFPSVLLKIKDWQNQYGAKRGNFQAYKRFANRRSQKIRKKLGINFGRKFDSQKFQKLFFNPQNLEQFDQKRIYQIFESLLLLVEKNFVFYEESKTQASQLKKKVVKKKLQRALHFLNTIQDNLGQYLNQKQKLELKVYESQIKIALMLQKKQFDEGKKQCLSLITILKQLQEHLTTIEKAQIQDIINETEKQLRYCKFQLREFDDGEEEEFVILGQTDIENMLQKIENETKSSSQQKCKIQLYTEDIEIEDQKMIALIQKSQKLTKTFQATSDINSKEDLFWEIVNNYEEGIKLCHTYKIDAGNNATLVNFLNKVENYFELKKTVMFLKKGIKVYNNVKNRQMNNNKDKPQEFVKISDMILGHLRKLTDIGSKYNQQNDLLNYLEINFRFIKGLGISSLYYTNQCYKYSLSLIQYNLKELEKEQQKQQMDVIQRQADVFDNQNQIDKQICLKDFLQQVQETNKKVMDKTLILRKQNKIALYDVQQTQMQSLKFEMEEMDFKFDKGANLNCLLDLVQENRESAVNEKMQFVKVPPVSDLVIPNPINLDLAGDFVDYAEMNYEKLEPEKKKGFFSSLWGS